MRLLLSTRLLNTGVLGLPKKIEESKLNYQSYLQIALVLFPDVASYPYTKPVNGLAKAERSGTKTGTVVHAMELLGCKLVLDLRIS